MKKHFSLKHCIAICLAMMLCATTIFAQQTTLKVSGKNVTTTFGQTITLRGINYPIIDDGSISLANAASYQFLIDEAAKTGANTIRLPWWLPGTHWRDGITPGTIAGYMNNGHMSNIIAYCISKKMIPVLELHNYTCSNNWTDFNNSITNFWLSAPVLSAINTNKSAIIINLANEFGYDANWGGNMATFTTNYTNAITAMRNAGVNVPIMIDAPNCGTASSSLVGVANSLLANDPQHNLIFSVHAYWGSYANNQAAITTKINEIDNSGTCFVFGEVANTQDDNGCGDMSLATIYPEVLTQACSKNIGWYAWTYDQDCSSPREMTTDGNFANLTIYGNDIVYNANYGLKSAGGCKAFAYSTTPACTPTTSTTTFNICPSELPYVYAGHTYSTAGTYTHNLTNAAGCDSTATVNIILKNVYTITPISAPNGTIDIMNVRNVCHGFSSNLYTLTPSSGFFIDSIILDGIPSKVNFNFKFSYSYSFSSVTSNHTIQGVFKPLCTPTTSTTNYTTTGSYTWNGTTYNASGTYTYTTTNAAGCDSVATLNLTITAYVGCFQQISVGAYHNLAIGNDGSLFGWGSNSIGQFGVIGYNMKDRPTQVNAATNWQSVSAGGDHSLALKNDGTIWTTGSNYYGELGNGTNSAGISFSQIGVANDWQKIFAGRWHSLAIKTNGTLWAWGRNSEGQIGNGNTNPINLPTQVGSDADWLMATGGAYTSAAIKTNGTLWTWGANTSYGLLGNGNNNAYSSPQQIGTANDWSFVSSSSYHTMALKTNGTLWAWGRGTEGQLGNGFNQNSGTPVQVGTSNDWHSVVAASFATLAIKNDGTLWAWGFNGSEGVLGTGTNIDSPIPVQIGTANNWVFVDAHEYHVVAMQADGKIFSWGSNLSGQLGDGTVVGKNVPTEISCSNICVPTSSTTTISACNSYFWYGTKYSSGTYSVVLTTANGCDSIAILNLTIKSSTNSTTNVTATGSYTWNGTTYNASGTYTYATINAAGCDSVATLNLTIQSNTALAISGTNNVCVGSNITLTANQAGGTWSSITGRATVSNVGVVTGTSAGTATIKYTVAGQSVTKIVTVYAIPSVPQFAYAPGTRSPQTTSVGGVIQMCTNKTFTLIGNPANGVWSRAGNFTASPLGTPSTNVNVNTAGASGMGSIAYTVTNSNGCSNSRVLSANIVSCGAKGLPSTDDRQPSTVDFVIYPNPAKNVLNIAITKLIGDGQIILTNMLGKQVATQALSMGNNTIDINNLAKGMYFVSVITNEGKQTKKLVVE